jgi:hypothetical protein
MDDAAAASQAETVQPAAMGVEQRHGHAALLLLRHTG